MKMSMWLEKFLLWMNILPGQSVVGKVPCGQSGCGLSLDWVKFLWAKFLDPHPSSGDAILLAK